MDWARERLEIMFTARLRISIGLGAGGPVLALMINRSVFLPMIIVALFQMIINQPYLWRRLTAVNPFTLARIHQYVDIMVLTAAIHFFGGMGSGPLPALYLPIIFFSAVSLKPREGIYTAAAAVAAFFGLIALEKMKLLGLQAPFLQEPMAGVRLAALVLATAFLFLLPAHVGVYVYRAIFGQEEELKKATERLARLFNEVWEAVMAIAQDGTMLRVNPLAAKLFQREIADLTGRKFQELLTPESQDDFAALLHDALTGERVTAAGWKFILPDGSERIIEVRASAFLQEPSAANLFLVLRDITEPRRMEEELKSYSVELYRRVEERTAELEESREHYSSLFENAAVPLCWLNPKGALVSANRSFWGLTGLDREQAGSLPLVEVLAKESDQLQVAGYLDLLRRGYDAPTRLELLVRRSDGAELWTEWFIRFDPLTDQLLVSMIDVTERKRAEEARKESEERHRLLVETSPDAIVLVDLSGKVIMANARAAELQGAASAEELIGAPSFDNIAPEDRARAMANVQKTLETGLVPNVEYKLARPDGSIYFGEITSALIRDREGRPKFLLGILRDITERKQAVQALKESEERYRLLVETSPDAIVVSDLTGKVIMANARAAELYGVASADELIGDAAFEYIAPEDRERAVENGRKTLETGQVRNIEYRILRRDGASYFGEITAALIKDLEGRPQAFIGIVRDISKRKRAEEALRESEIRYRTLFEESHDAIYIINREGNVIDVSRAAEELSGYSREELLGMNAFQIYENVQDRENFTKVVEQAGFAKDYPLRFKRRDGTVLDCLVTSTVRRNAAGEVIGFQGIVRDITAQKRIEEALKKREEYFRSLIENSQDIITILDREGVIRYESPAAERVLGFRPEELIGRPALAMVHPEDLTRIGKLFQRGLQNPGNTAIFEFRTRHQDGSWRTLEATAKNLLEDPVVAGFVINSRDVTERKRAAEALKKSEERYRFLAENVTDIIWTMDLNLRYTYVSPAVIRMRGYTAEEGITQTLDQVLTPASLAVALKAFQEELEIEKLPDQDPHRSRILELEQTLKGGGTIWTEVKVTWLRDAQGKPFGVLGVTRDISQRKEVDRAREEFQTQLRQAEQMALAGQIAAGVAHEMNNPLTAVSYYARALEKALAKKSKERDKVKHIQEASDRMQRLVARLLNYTSLARAEFRPVDLNAVVRQVLDANAHELEKRPQAKVGLRLETDLPPVEGAAEPLFHLIGNLLLNALQSLPEEKGKVEIATRKRGETVELAIRDTGVGIAPEDRPEIFTPFFTRRAGGQGTGLGLAIVQEVVRMHKAEIAVESEPGQGATFTVIFPQA